ncbi:MAG TPA: hypothetical protein VFH59_11015 [Frateuria sp.]|uniref:hypothetical protein n=1 Tax=Frateuria sp. TaxID=2211372 RepID=UPI002D801591|nr:hypothetical protein [Frateuria sp.]HET6805958.1 hypothetical protein [Frateuria sp.]
MFHYLDRYAANDSFVKLVFDHLKNLTVVAALFAAAAWKQKHISPGWLGGWDIACSALLGLLALSLMWLNHTNLFLKLHDTLSSRWVKAAAAVLYAILFGTLLAYAERGRP